MTKAVPSLISLQTSGASVTQPVIASESNAKLLSMLDYAASEKARR